MKALIIVLFILVALKVLVYISDLKKDVFPKVQEISKGFTEFLLVVDIALLIWIGYYILS